MYLSQRLCLAPMGLFCTMVLAQPRLVQMNSSFRPPNTSALAPIETVTFSIYAEETGGAPLWQETQNVTVGRTQRTPGIEAQ